MTAIMLHTGLTLEDVDTINGCRQRLLSSAVLLELGLSHMEGDEVSSDPEAIRIAMLDVVDRLREDVTLIAATIELAGGRQSEAGRAEDKRASVGTGRSRR